MNSALVRTLEMISAPPKPPPPTVVDVISEVADEIGFVPDWWGDNQLPTFTVTGDDDAQSWG